MNEEKVITLTPGNIDIAGTWTIGEMLDLFEKAIDLVRGIPIKFNKEDQKED